MPGRRIPLKAQLCCPVCQVAMKHHCPRPDCWIWMCADCSLGWDAKTKHAFVLRVSIRHEEY